MEPVKTNTVSVADDRPTLSVLDIYHDSIVDGTGLRTVIWFAGCPHRCFGCHNPASWNRHNGKRMSVNEVYDEVVSNPLTNVTFSGGEPYIQAQAILPLAKRLKKAGKQIWSYSGFTIAEIRSDPTRNRLLQQVDVLVDGRFEWDKRDSSLCFRGSSNQVIHYL